MTEPTENNAPFVRLDKALALCASAACGAAGLGVLCLLAARADFEKWTLGEPLRELAARCGVSVNTLRKTLAQLEKAGFLTQEAAERTQTRLTLTAFLEPQSWKSVSNFDTEQKIFAQKNKSVSKIDTEKDTLLSLFPQFVVKTGQKAGAAVSNFDTETPKNAKAVSKIDTDKSVSNFDTAHPLHTTPKEVINNNINNNKAKSGEEKTKNAVSINDVKAYFAEKNYTTDPEEFYYKNEARGWTWTDRAGKTHKIKNWKGCAWEFEKKTKARGAVNWQNPQKNEERLFAWYYRTLLPQAFDNEAARESRWSREKGDFAFIASVAGDLERAKQIVIRGAEMLEKDGFVPSVRALANNAMRVNDELDGKGGR